MSAFPPSREIRQIPLPRGFEAKQSRLLEKRLQKLALRCLSNSLLDDSVRDTMTTKTVRHDCDRIAFDPGKVLAKRLSDVETDKGLITAEPKCRRDLFKAIQNIFRHTDADRSHRARFFEPLL